MRPTAMNNTPPPPDPSLLPAVLAGSAIALAGLVAAGVVVFTSRGGNPVGPPAEGRPPAAHFAAEDPESDLPVGAGDPRAADQARETDSAAHELVAEGRPQPPGPRSEPPGDKPALREPADRDFPAAAGRVEAAEAAGANVPLPPLAPAPPAPPVPGAAADPSPQVAGDPALAEAVAVVAKLPFAIDLLPSAAILEGGLGRRRRGSIDLGPCSPEAAACLEITLAQPAQQDRESEVALQVVAAELAEDGWSIRRIESGIDGETVGRDVATLSIEEGRMQLTGSNSLPPDAALTLARSVLLVRAGGGPWKPVRLVHPNSVDPLRFSALGDERAKTELPLPGPFAGQGIPTGCRIEIVSGREKVTLKPPPGRPGVAFGVDLPLAELMDGSKLVVRLRIQPQQGQDGQPVLVAETGIVGLEGKPSQERQRSRQLANLGRATKKAIADTTAGWDRALGELMSTAPAAVRPGAVEAFLKEPLPPSAKLPIPVRFEPLGDAFDRFLVAAAKGNNFRGRGGLPVSRRDWEQDWQAAIRNSGSYTYGVSQQEWANTYKRPLQEWWAEYRPQAVEKLTVAADAVVKLATDAVVIEIARVAVDAVGPDGKPHVVTLVERGDGAAKPDLSGQPIGID